MSGLAPSAFVGTSNTTLFTAAGDDAIVYMNFTNITASPAVLNVFLVPNGESAGDTNKIVADLTIVAKDSRVYTSADTETKIILTTGDRIIAICDTASAINSTISFMDLS